MENRRIPRNGGEVLQHDGDKNGNINDVHYTFKDEYYAPEGRRGWLIVAAAFFSLFILEGITRSFDSIFVKDDLDINRSKKYSTIFPHTLTFKERNFIENVIPITTGLIAPFASCLAEKFGFRRTAMLGSTLATIGIFLSISQGNPNFYLFLFGYGILAGMGFGTMFTLAIVIVGLYFEKRRGLAIGVTMLGTSVGAVGLIPVTVVVAEFVGGWHGAVYFQGGLCALSWLFALAYKPRPTRAVKVLKSKMNEEGGLSPLEQLCSLLSSPSFLILCISGSFFIMGVFSSVRFVKPRLSNVSQGNDSVIIFLTFAISKLVAFILFGIFADKLGNAIRISNVMLTLGALATGAFALSNGFWCMLASAVGIGLNLGMFCTLRPILIMEVVKEKRFNLGIGISLFFWGIAGVVNYTFVGYLIKSMDTYDEAFYLGGGFLLLSAVMCYPLASIRDWEERRKCKRLIESFEVSRI